MIEFSLLPITEVSKTSYNMQTLNANFIICMDEMRCYGYKNLRLKIWLYLSNLHSLAQPWILHDCDKMGFWVLTYEVTIQTCTSSRLIYNYSRHPVHFNLIIL